MIEDADIAQARVLRDALCTQLQDMTATLATIERDRGSVDSHRGLALRRRAAELRQEISTAQYLVARLCRRFPEIVERSREVGARV
ncbi:hypothetical protein [Mycolicibacterium palauense]|uniref:hypothetical protein n=1 Tax=Mycolicibacterium palauense TaxID=2034511 RepID=UPI000BFEDEE7|nr:hypothetical protein [Mycolicibacterium palauense]